MFESAKRMGYLRELDWISRRAAMEGGSNDSREKPLFINVSATSLLDRVHDVDQLLMLAQWARRSPTKIVLELTELDDARDLERLRDVIRSYRANGFRFAIGDVGEGHSSIELLITANPEFIKIARSLTGQTAKQASRSAIQAILTFAGAQGTTVVAEGIETEQQLSTVRELGIGLGQGYLLGRPENQPVTTESMAVNL
jgi:EAL domain-containing protein (putative c-di-GMP-specific phosphodiesterase class I)